MLEINRALMCHEKWETNPSIWSCHCSFTTPTYIVDPNWYKRPFYGPPIHVFWAYVRTYITAVLSISRRFIWTAKWNILNWWYFYAYRLCVIFKTGCRDKMYTSVIFPQLKYSFQSLRKKEKRMVSRYQYLHGCSFVHKHLRLEGRSHAGTTKTLNVDTRV